MNNKPTLEQCEKISHLFPKSREIFATVRKKHQKKGKSYDPYINLRRGLPPSDKFLLNCPDLEEMMGWLFDRGFRVVQYAKGKFEIQKKEGGSDDCFDWLNAWKVFEAQNTPEAYAIACGIVAGLEEG